jgi:hypothetical protein
LLSVSVPIWGSYPYPQLGCRTQGGMLRCARPRSSTSSSEAARGALSAPQQRLRNILQRHRNFCQGLWRSPRGWVFPGKPFFVSTRRRMVGLGGVNKLLSIGSCDAERAPPDGLFCAVLLLSRCVQQHCRAWSVWGWGENPHIPRQFFLNPK